MGRIPKIDKERALEVARRKTVDKLQTHQTASKMGRMTQPYLQMTMNDQDRVMSNDDMGHPYVGYKHGMMQACHSTYDLQDRRQQMQSMTQGDRTLNMNVDLNMMHSSNMNSHSDIIMGSETSSRSSSVNSIHNTYNPGVIKELFNQVVDAPLQDTDNQSMLHRYLHNVAHKQTGIDTQQYDGSQIHSFNSGSLHLGEERMYHNHMGFTGQQGWLSGQEAKCSTTNR